MLLDIAWNIIKLNKLKSSTKMKPMFLDTRNFNYYYFLK